MRRDVFLQTKFTYQRGQDHRLRFALAVGMLPLTGTSNAQHMRQDLASASIKLAPDELNQIERIGVTSS